jgi:hypothetical protein
MARIAALGTSLAQAAGILPGTVGTTSMAATAATKKVSLEAVLALHHLMAVKPTSIADEALLPRTHMPGPP